MTRIVIAAAALLVALPAGADELQSRLLAAARASDTSAYGFRETIAVAMTGADAKTYVNAYDPRRAPADRWRLVSVDGRAPTAKEVERSRKTKRDSPPSYHGLADWLGAPATRTDGPGGTVTYRYARLPAGTLKLGKHDASADTAAEVVVNPGGGDPFVERVRFASTRGFRMMLVASVRSMTTTMRFRRLPDGRVVPADVASNVAGSMMGKSGDLRTTLAYADWQKVK